MCGRKHRTKIIQNIKRRQHAILIGWTKGHDTSRLIASGDEFTANIHWLKTAIPKKTNNRFTLHQAVSIELYNRARGNAFADALTKEPDAELTPEYTRQIKQRNQWNFILPTSHGE